MPVNKYVTLENSNASVVKNFKAIALKMPLQRTDTIDYTVGGGVDKHTGPIIQSFSYVFRVPQDEQLDENWGTMDDLRALFNLVNPNGTPSDVITLTDHFGDEYECYFTGEISPEPMTTMLEGHSAWYLVPVTLQVIPAGVGGS